MTDQFKPIPDYNLLIANFGEGTNSRIIIFRTPDATMTDPWEKIPGTNILLIGRATRAELHKYIQNTSWRATDQQLPNGIGGRTYTAIRKYLGLYNPRQH